MDNYDSQTRTDLFDYLLRIADDLLIIGHRTSEWCAHGPYLEEDIALTNIALDCIGQAAPILRLAGEVEGNNRSEDDLAYFRDAVAFRNCQLVEQPNGDFGKTIARQLLFSTFNYLRFRELSKSACKELAALAAKGLKEVTYHLRHSREWTLRLGDGTEQSHQRIQDSYDQLWMFTGELFETDDIETRLVNKGIAVDSSTLKDEWHELVSSVLNEATLRTPSDERYMASGSRQGKHSEHLGYILAELQIIPRSYPDARW